MIHEQIEQGRLFELFSFDFVAGKVFWKSPSKYHREKAGSEAGCKRPCSGRPNKLYWYIKIDGRPYKRAWLMYAAKNKVWPEMMLDHINGDSLDDRPENLRLANAFQNAWNHKTRKKKASTPMGVRATISGRFQARIAQFNKQFVIGTFDSQDEAEHAYLNKRRELYGDFS